MADDSEELETFLQDVDEVGSIIKNLSSEDEEKFKIAMKASEEILQKKQSQLNCDKINKYESTRDDKSSTNIEGNNERCQEEILRGIEQDAKERARRRKKNEEDAQSLKAKGNLAFKAGRYEEAIERYTEAILIVKYLPTLYTNRAQAYILVGKYDAAIDDCKWAMRVDEKCVKAYVHCGRALHKTSFFSEAISYFKMAEVIDPKQKNVIKEYISAVEQDQEKFDLERKAFTDLENGDDHLRLLVEGVELLLEENKELREYISAADNVKEVLKNNKPGKTLFRVKRGFDCFSEQSYFNRLCNMEDRCELPEQDIFVCKMLELAKISIEDAECNLEELVDHGGALKTIQQLLKRSPRHVEKILLSSLLLHQISECSQGRKRITEYAADARFFMDNLFQLVKELNSVSKVVMGCLNNLSLETRYCKELEGVSLSIINRFVNISIDWSDETYLLTVASCLSTIANLARVKDTRQRLQRNRQIWELALNVFARCANDSNDENVREIIYAVLGLLSNVLSESSEYAKTYSTFLTPFLCAFLESHHKMKLLQRTVGALRLLMSYSQEVINLVCSAKIYEVILQLVKKASDDLTVSYGIKCLALCVVNNGIARKHIIESGMMTLHQHLMSKNEVTVGNSALILGNCFEQKGASEQLVGRPIVSDLLSIASNTKLAKDVQHNAAVALAKLVKNDLRHLDELRELHGLEILHSVIKSNES